MPIDTVGLYAPSAGYFFLNTANTGGSAPIEFQFGSANQGFTAVSGDWTGIAAGLPSSNGSSTLWAGYMAAVNVNSPSSYSDTVSAVSGSWNVPVVAPSGSGHLSTWVGIDGDGNGTTVEQTGTAEVVTNGIVSYYAWYEMYPLGEVKVNFMTVSPGDSITASVTYQSSGTYQGDFLLSITDNTTNLSDYTYAPTVSGTTPLRDSAEWINEAVGGVPAPAFTPTTFSSATATIDGSTGPINSANWQNLAIVQTTGASYPSMYPTILGKNYGASPNTGAFEVIYNAANQTPYVIVGNPVSAVSVASATTGTGSPISFGVADSVVSGPAVVSVAQPAPANSATPVLAPLSSSASGSTSNNPFADVDSVFDSLEEADPLGVPLG